LRTIYTANVEIKHKSLTTIRTFYFDSQQERNLFLNTAQGMSIKLIAISLQYVCDANEALQELAKEIEAPLQTQCFAVR